MPIARNVVLQRLDDFRITRRRSIAQVGDVGEEIFAYNTFLGTGGLNGPPDRRQQLPLLLRLPPHRDMRIVGRRQIYDDHRVLVAPVAVYVLHQLGGPPAGVQRRVPAQLPALLLNHLVQTGAHLPPHRVIEGLVGHGSWTPGQRGGRPSKHSAVGLVALIELLNHLLEALLRRLPHPGQDLVRGAVVCDAVEEKHRRLGNLGGVFCLLIPLLQAHRRHGRHSRLPVGELRVQIDPLGDLCSQLIGVQPPKGLPHMGFFSYDKECGHYLSHRSHVNVLTLVSLVLGGHIVGVQQGQIIQPLRLLQPDQLGHQAEHSFGVSLLVTHCGKDQVAFQMLRIPADLLQQLDQDRVSHLHVKDAPAEEIVPGLQILPDFWGQVQLL